MAFRSALALYAVSLALIDPILGHGGAHQQPIELDPQVDWATRHMAEEHHITSFDALSFFTIHDFNDDGIWSPAEITKLYGLADTTGNTEMAVITPEKKKAVVDSILEHIDKNKDGLVSKQEWLEWSANGGILPDFDTGPGHHGDDEYEYEIHHWEKYHDENTREEDLTHPEDIEHFKKHDDMEDEALRLEALDKMSIVESNIPQKFRRN